MNEYIIYKNDDYQCVPSKELCISLLNNIRYLFFPGFYKCNNDSFENIKDNIKDILMRQLKCAYTLDKNDTMSFSIVEEFMQKLLLVSDSLKTDLQATFVADPAANDYTEIILTYPGFNAILIYRIAHALYELNVPYIPRILSEYAHSVTGIDIHPGAIIDNYFFIDHGTGIVIGETSIIGHHVKIYQGVTIGALSLGRGQKLKGSKRHPTIGNNVTIYAGASILGGNTLIGDNVIIGSNTYILESISSNSIIRLKSVDMEIIKK